MRYPKDIRDIVEAAPEEAQVYLRKHNPLKVRLTLFMCKRLRAAFNGNFSSESDLVSLASCVVFNNIDELIDDGAITSPEEKKQIVTYFQDCIAGQTQPLLTHENVDPLKFRELEFLCYKIRTSVATSVGKEVYFEVMDQLAEVVKLQIEGDFEKVKTPEQKELESSCQSVDHTIKQYGFAPEIEDRLKLATRMGAYTGGLMVPISDIPPDSQDIEAIYTFGAAFQIIDDLCDLADDLEKGQETFATWAYKDENFVEIKTQIKALAKELFERANSLTDSRFKKLKLQIFKKIFDVFTLANSTSNLRKVLNSQKRLGTKTS